MSINNVLDMTMDKLKNDNYKYLQEDISNLEKILSITGYAYDPKQNIFYSIKDAWQRDYGYIRIYDDAAPTLNLIYDCEPIYFEYDNKRWLIELWKGQYGMTTGCEIGIYTSEGSDYNIPDYINYFFYNAASDKDCLYMSCTLKKNSEILFKRSDAHWWLTGFVLGEFSEPSELEMDAAISLKDKNMSEAFVEGLIDTGYSERDISVQNNTVSFTFSNPFSTQPMTRNLFKNLSQATNKILCRIYRDFTEDADSMYEALDIIKRKSPILYNLIINIGKPSRLYKDNKFIYEAKSRILA